MFSNSGHFYLVSSIILLRRAGVVPKWKLFNESLPAVYVPEVLSMARTPATKHVISVFSSLIRLFKQRLTNLKQ